MPCHTFKSYYRYIEYTELFSIILRAITHATGQASAEFQHRLLDADFCKASWRLIIGKYDEPLPSAPL